MNNNKSVQVVALLTVAVLTLGTMQFAAAGGSETKLQAELTGDDTQASGKVKFEDRTGDRVRLSVEAEDLPADTVFTITVNDFSTDITSDGLGGFDLNLDNRDGDTVPSLTAGDKVTVSGGGITISGTL